MLLPLLLVKMLLRYFKYVNDPTETNAFKKGKISSPRPCGLFKTMVRNLRTPGRSDLHLVRNNDFLKAINFFYFGKSSSNKEITKVSDSEDVQDSPNMILFKKAMNLILGNALTLIQ